MSLSSCFLSIAVCCLVGEKQDRVIMNLTSGHNCNIYNCTNEEQRDQILRKVWMNSKPIPPQPKRVEDVMCYNPYGSITSQIMYHCPPNVAGANAVAYALPSVIQLYKRLVCQIGLSVCSRLYRFFFTRFS